MPFRIDIGSLRPPERLADGRLRADALITRAGVFEYLNPDGSIRREYRAPKEVFGAASMSTFAMAPVTNNHPDAMLTAETIRDHVVGWCGEPRRDGDHVAVPIMFFDAKAIEDLQSGKDQLSCGYECDLDMSPGTTPEGERFDCSQINIRGNHVAIVDRARAGDHARVRMDASEMINRDVGENMPTIAELTAENAELRARLDAMPPALAKKLKGGDDEDPEDDDEDPEDDDEEKPAPKAKGKGKKAPPFEKKDRAEIDRLRGERDAAIAERDAMKAKRKDAAESTALASAVAARVKLERAAGSVLRNDSGADDLSGLSDRDVMIAVVKAVDKFDCTDAHSIEYVTARYDSAISRVADSGAAHDAIRTVAVGNTRGDAAPVQNARERMIARNLNLSNKAS